MVFQEGGLEQPVCQPGTYDFTIWTACNTTARADGNALSAAETTQALHLARPFSEMLWKPVLVLRPRLRSACFKRSAKRSCRVLRTLTRAWPERPSDAIRQVCAWILPGVAMDPSARGRPLLLACTRSMRRHIRAGQEGESGHSWQSSRVGDNRDLGGAQSGHRTGNSGAVAHRSRHPEFTRGQAERTHPLLNYATTLHMSLIRARSSGSVA
ncbi:hypothetical protein KFL_001450130 [Klebsormidium nitens]|uniref:Uncharacterized protein n=1 Tax=Klebsormidium nitens TaxID=105231 RepID=A0A1Y1I2F1_KLENI|nr:hypothetical protein KFL_001450130 [Klebsormidium nitens]|eukprot:GAQ83361.1 hypothetical protein KFL_001450130 [Klebsormidium nitens]